jgi:hypothetical protein
MFPHRFFSLALDLLNYLITDTGYGSWIGSADRSRRHQPTSSANETEIVCAKSI